MGSKPRAPWAALLEVSCHILPYLAIPFSASTSLTAFGTSVDTHFIPGFL